MKKRYRVEVVSRYEDGYDTETIYVWAFNAEHAEEVAWDRCGGESGACGGVEFRVTRLRK